LVYLNELGLSHQTLSDLVHAGCREPAPAAGEPPPGAPRHAGPDRTVPSAGRARTPGPPQSGRFAEWSL